MYVSGVVCPQVVTPKYDDATALDSSNLTGPEVDHQNKQVESKEATNKDSGCNFRHKMKTSIV